MGGQGSLRGQFLSYEQPTRRVQHDAGEGHIIWVAYIDNEEHVIATGAGGYSALSPWVRTLDEAITQNLVPRSAQ
jgi:hypothetical protein